MTRPIAYRVVPNPVFGIMSFVNGLENITNQCVKVCDFCFSLVQRPVWVQNNHYHSLEKHAFQIIFTDRALLTISCRGQIWGQNIAIECESYSVQQVMNKLELQSVLLMCWAGVDVWWSDLDCHLFTGGTCVPQNLTLLLARWRCSHHQPQHPAHRWSLDGWL